MDTEDILKGVKNPTLVYRFVITRIKRWIAYQLKDEMVKAPYVHGPESRLTLGENTGMPSVVNTRSGDVTIGDNVITGIGSSLLTGMHEYKKRGAGRAPAVTDAGRDILIKDGVWIGWNVTIVGPCEIGSNAVIAAGSVVVDDCEPGAIYAGNPAEKISEIDFDQP